MQGVSKAGLMGFCDPAPGEDKVLRIYYAVRDFCYTATIGDKVWPSMCREDWVE